MVSVELSRLIALVAQEVMAASRRPPARCGCHAVIEDCCPSRLKPIVEAGAARIGVHAGGGAPPDVAAIIDHTLLKPDATGTDIDRLCDEARQYGFAAVCVNPVWVARAAARLRGASAVVAAVVGFPLGATPRDVKAYEARRVLFDGAREVDMVIDIGALKSGDLTAVQRDIACVTDVCAGCGVLVKVIIEAALLTDAEKVAACTIAKAAGAGFVKTSTGFGPGGATVADVALMRRVVGDDMGVKAAGGVGDLQKLRELVAAGATRVGASAGVRIVQQQQPG
jgi:deoxyribose-phosphate aldolase